MVNSGWCSCVSLAAALCKAHHESVTETQSLALLKSLGKRVQKQLCAVIDTNSTLSGTSDLLPASQLPHWRPKNCQSVPTHVTAYQLELGGGDH